MEGREFRKLKIVSQLQENLIVKPLLFQFVITETFCMLSVTKINNIKGIKITWFKMLPSSVQVTPSVRGPIVILISKSRKHFMKTNLLWNMEI